MRRSGADGSAKKATEPFQTGRKVQGRGFEKFLARNLVAIPHWALNRHPGAVGVRNVSSRNRAPGPAPVLPAGRQHGGRRSALRAQAAVPVPLLWLFASLLLSAPVAPPPSQIQPSRSPIFHMASSSSSAGVLALKRPVFPPVSEAPLAPR